MKNDQPVTIYRKDYQPFPFDVESLNLTFKLYEDKTVVLSRASYKRTHKTDESDKDLYLYGEELELIHIAVDGVSLGQDRYSIDDKGLKIMDPKESFVLELETVIYPDKNSSLEGLYRSSGNYCTQCEAEGFRKITYYPDRPDVLTVFTTRIEADKGRCPVMLSNGNLIDSGELEEGRHFAVWEDPFAKPCYLFALVAGKLVSLNDSFTTKSGREVDLKIYVEEKNQGKCDHAMESLKKSMQWDEDVFGLEYDLDIFMIVAVDDFNMGAMENKGLNVFNSKYVLSTPQSATDGDYLGIEGVIGHEYFHNWTGNRVTCRDWFQLSLKEGLTVFRDQEFSSDLNSRAVQRIDDVKLLRNVQFREDSGPMAHPVRPDSFVEINNFYTATVYNKGAEVIRMMHTLIGKDSFQKGMDLYFQRHDGQAVTCDDFVAAMEDASGVNLEQFRLWYSQAGTPELKVSQQWDQEQKQFHLTVSQSCPETPGQKVKKPFHIPIKVGLLDKKDGERVSSTLELKGGKETFTFESIEEQPVLSFLRDFSAPVRVQQFLSDEELAFLMANDTNLFNRWDSASELSTKVILALTDQIRSEKVVSVDDFYLKAVGKTLGADMDDKDLYALALNLPPETTVAQEMDEVYPQALHKARNYLKEQVALRFQDQLLKLYHANSSLEPYSVTPSAKGMRSLKNVCLSYLMSLDPLPTEILEICKSQYENSTNMTDTMAALSLLGSVDAEIRKEVLEDFFNKWQDDTLVLDKWFAVQALADIPGVLEEVRKLLDHEKFSLKNPNKVRSLIGTFASGNHAAFHQRSGEGYRFLSAQIIALNATNPQIAARLISPFLTWKRYEPELRRYMEKELRLIRSQKDLSQDVFEIVNNALS